MLQMITDVLHSRGGGRWRRLPIKGLELKEILASRSLVNSLFNLSFFQHFLHIRSLEIYVLTLINIICLFNSCFLFPFNF